MFCYELKKRVLKETAAREQKQGFTILVLFFLPFLINKHKSSR